MAAQEEDACEGWAALAAELEISSDGEADENWGAMPQSRTAEAAPSVASRESLTHAEFAERFRHRQPVVLRGFAASWPAISRWGAVSHLSELLTGHHEAGSSASSTEGGIRGRESDSACIG